MQKVDEDQRETADTPPGAPLWAKKGACLLLHVGVLCPRRSYLYLFTLALLPWCQALG